MTFDINELRTIAKTLDEHWPIAARKMRDAAAEIEHLQGLFDDKEYLRWKVDYNRGHLSYAGQIATRERRKESR